jgi:hypothetical protein
MTVAESHVSALSLDRQTAEDALAMMRECLIDAVAVEVPR